MSDDLDNDYVKIKRNLFDLTDQGTEAIEVLGQLIKQNAEIGEKILKMHKTKKEVEKVDDKPALEDKGVTNNNVFIGSTADLQKMLRDEIVINATKED